MKHDQTVYTCDGCQKTQAVDLQATPPGWYRVTTGEVSKGTAAARECYLCLRCFSGVDWIIRFQGLIVPPAVIAEPKPMRRHIDHPSNVEPNLPASESCPAADEHDHMTHCGLCGWEPAYDVLTLPLTRDTLPAAQMWLEPMTYSTDSSGLPRVTGTLRGHWQRLGRRETRPGEDRDVTVTVVDLVETADGHLHRADGVAEEPTA